MRERDEVYIPPRTTHSSPDKSYTYPVTVKMSSRIPLQIISTNTPDYSSMMYEPYCPCSYCENPSYYPTMEIDCHTMPMSTSLESREMTKKSTRRSKHIPHHLRPQHIVERRNRRERLRVQDVNQAFCMLQQLLPFDSNSPTNHHTKEQNTSRISKLRTLQKAIDYIEALQKMLNESY